MNKSTVHLVATILWGVYGLTTGSLGVFYDHFNAYLMVSIVTAIVGNSAHLISMSMSAQSMDVTSQVQPKA